jgi:iron complex outermembrane receptor protein
MPPIRPLELQGTATTACNQTEQRLAPLPRHALTGGGDYARASRNDTALLHVDIADRSEFDGDPSLSRYTRILGYTLTNASLG